MFSTTAANGDQSESPNAPSVENVEMTVHYANGMSESVALDYPFHYASSADDPWSAQNANNPNFPATFQTPPPDQAGSEPAIVKYVMARSTADGYTTLKPCQ